MKTIQLNDENFIKLVKMKYSLDCRSYDELIERILSMITKFKLNKELEK